MSQRNVKSQSSSQRLTQSQRGTPSTSQRNVKSQSSSQRLTQSQRGTQSQKAQSQKLAIDELKSVANKTVFYLIATHGCKGVIKRSDLTMAMIGPQYSRHFKTIIALANKKMKKIFGMKIIPSDDKYTHLILINYLERNSNVLLNIDTKQKSSDTLLFTVLAVILMNNDCMSEAMLLKFLETLGFSENNKEYGLGKMSDLLRKEYVNQFYLKCTPIENDKVGDDVQYEYSWGVRAHNQINKRKILEFVSKIYECQPSTWIEQESKIKDEEGNDLNATQLDESSTDNESSSNSETECDDD